MENTDEQERALAVQVKYLKLNSDIAANQLISSNELCRLVKANQEDGRRWRIVDMRLSTTVLFVAIIGVSFDMIVVNANSSMITWLSNLFGV